MNLSYYLVLTEEKAKISLPQRICIIQRLLMSPCLYTVVRISNLQSGISTWSTEYRSEIYNAEHAIHDTDTLGT